jgi:LSD1 subclass zinc finger protein
VAEAWPTNAARRAGRSEEPRPYCVTQGNTLSLLPSGPDEVRCACCTGPGLIPAGRKTGGIVTRTVPEPRRPRRTSTSGYTRKALHSRFLTVYLFAVILVSGVWIGTPALFPLTWITALAVGAATQTLTFRLPLPAGAAVHANARDALLTIVASAPAVVYLIGTWRQEFSDLGDQIAAQRQCNRGVRILVAVGMDCRGHCDGIRCMARPAERRLSSSPDRSRRRGRDRVGAAAAAGVFRTLPRHAAPLLGPPARGDACDISAECRAIAEHAGDSHLAARG